MIKEKILSILLIAGAIMCLSVVAGCGHSKEIDDKLDHAERLMEIHPDSSLVILDEINASELNRGDLKARHALLKSMALDKNYIDTTTFDVLQPAIDYYLKAGNADERLRTYYYQGRIYRNAGEYDLAMQSYLIGLENIGHITDSLTYVRMLIGQAVLYHKEYQISKVVDNNLKAAEIYGKLGRQSQRLKCYLRALQGEIILRNNYAADSILMICKEIVKDSPALKNETLGSFLLYAVVYGNNKETMNTDSYTQLRAQDNNANMLNGDEG